MWICVRLLHCNLLILTSASFLSFMCEQALQEHYGSEGFARHGVGLLLATLSKMFDSFQEAYQGQLS